MATISHTIYSHYSPKKSETLVTPPSYAFDESADPWETESFPKARRSVGAPRFVPATMSHENAGFHQPNHTVDSSDVGASLAGWYRSLTDTQGTVDRPSLAVQSCTIAGPSNPSVDTQEVPKRAESRNKNNWFISRAIESEPSSGSSAPSPTPTLADILARDPPPIEGGYSPPVWLALGPSNKGFTMLQQRGWNEGEGLGPRVRRRRRIEGDFLDAEEPFEKKKAGLEARRLAVKQEERKLKWEEDVQEIRNVDVIDLTHSDSEDDVPESGADEDTPGDPPDPLDISFGSASPHSPRALLTPIATVLKSDRLGIGLKAKTVGPYKASQKRVTHSAAALTAHIKAAEDLRMKKAVMGRGRRGFAKIAKKEQERRLKMLAYLNE